MSAYDVRQAVFDELDARTAYRLWALRESVFVVEQECAYLELDGRDLEPTTVHVWASDSGTPVGYLRLLQDPAPDEDRLKIGRVLVTRSHRGRGLARTLMGRALEIVGARRSRLDAQSRLAGWYAGFGFRQDGEEFVEDGLWHTPMSRPSPTSACPRW
jgi:ElaA protein